MAGLAHRLLISLVLGVGIVVATILLLWLGIVASVALRIRGIVLAHLPVGLSMLEAACRRRTK